MRRLLQPLLLYLTVASDRELARQVQFLMEQNRILRAKLPQRISITVQERRRLLKFGRGLKRPVLKELLTVVTPQTFARWVSDERKPKSKAALEPRKPGRPRTPEEIRDLVLCIAEETGWGSKKIVGELLKLGISIARTTVNDILKAHGFDPSPKRSEGTWREFVRRHIETLWACDFFSKKVLTKAGLVDVFVLFFIHVGSRRVHIAGLTTNPDEAWVVQQARNMSMVFAEQSIAPSHLIMDMGTKFTKKFRDTLASDGMEILRVGPRKPNLNAHAERLRAVDQTRVSGPFRLYRHRSSGLHRSEVRSL
jgi:putative transposase